MDIESIALNIERGILGLDLISAHLGGDPAKFPELFRRRLQGPWAGAKMGAKSVTLQKNGPVKVSGGCGSFRNQMLYRTLHSTPFSSASGIQNNKQMSKNSTLGQNPEGCRPENPSLYQPLGLGY